MKQNDDQKYYPYQDIERRLSREWVVSKRFSDAPGGAEKRFTIVVPPPNITGILHLGHALNATIQDALARQARIDGRSVCWAPGSDHASIATETKVVEQLKKEEGLEKRDISREEFLRRAWAWKEKHEGIIYDQFKRLGCSMDWEKTTFTLDDHYYKAVIRIFVDLYREGLIYKGYRMVHWDTVAQTALSDEEVDHQEKNAVLYYVKYIFEDDKNAFITVATQRPETIMGDTAVCVHPDDARYKSYIGKNVLVPLIGRAVPIIADKSVDPAFGTGALKITPAHSMEDYRIGQENNLPLISIFNLDGKLNKNAQIAVGKTIEEAKKIVVDMLEKEGLLARKENYITRVGYSQRTGAAVEPFVSNQWFLKMKELAAPAVDAIKEKKIIFYPEQRFESAYYHWMDNIKDWCISRQLWWGHRIPAWYDKNNRLYVAENEDDAYLQYIKATQTNANIEELKKEKALKQDEDCLDTWFSSWIWPIEIFYGITQKERKDFSRYYPTSVLVTGHDILFFWVARMIMAGLHFKKEIPFRHVYFTGMVRDDQGRKMSKSLGNSPDLIKLIDEYSADAVRFGLMVCSPAGNDLLFSEQTLLQGKIFNNKLWNVWKFIRSLKEKIAKDATIGESETFANEWIRAAIAEARKEVEECFASYKLSDALKKIYSLIRGSFCNEYIEWIKPRAGERIAERQYAEAISIWRDCLQMLHPFMPFITEELYDLSFDGEAAEKRSIYFPVHKTSIDTRILQKGTAIANMISLIRDAKQKYNMQKESPWALYIEQKAEDPIMESLIKKQTQCADFHFVNALPGGVVLIPYEHWRIGIRIENAAENLEKDAEKIKKELERQEGLLFSIRRKLENEKFVASAKEEVIHLERKKMQDTLGRIAALKKSLE